MKVRMALNPSPKTCSHWRRSSTSRSVVQLAALYVDQEVRAVLAVDDEVEALELGVGEQRLLRFIDGDVRDPALPQELLERRLIMDAAIGHAASILIHVYGGGIDA
jgi:hypothetical protein